MELGQCHFHHIALAKASHKCGLDSRVGTETLPLNRRGYHATLQKDMPTGRGIIVAIAARNFPKSCSLYTVCVAGGEDPAKN